MPLRPDDVVRKSFSTAILRGYDEKQVDGFLEEVVGELRRLYGRIDTLEAEAAALRSRSKGEQMGVRVDREQQQVELIRAERRDLVGEISQAQARLDQITAEVRVAEERVARATTAAEDAERRRVESRLELDERGQTPMAAGAESEVDSPAAERTFAAQESLRAPSEERPYVFAGSEGRTGDASDMGSAEAASAEHMRLVGEAEKRRADVLVDLNARRQQLEARIEELDRRETEYRQRIRALTEEQMAWLDADGWKA